MPYAGDKLVVNIDNMRSIPLRLHSEKYGDGGNKQE